MTRIEEQIIKLNQNYNDLGEDLLLLEAVALAASDSGFPKEYIASSVERMLMCIDQHTADIRFFAAMLCEETSSCPELPKRYGREYRQHRRTDASHHTREPARFRADSRRDKRKANTPRNNKGFLNRRR